MFLLLMLCGLIDMIPDRVMLVTFISLLGLALCGNGSETSDASIYEGAKIAAYPYQASIEVDGHHLCGATITNDFWVLTAQSCLRNLTKSTVKVRVGTNTLGSQGTLHAVEKAVNYTSFIFFPENADLSMYKVSKSFNYKASVKRLDIAEESPSEGDTGYITGWGKTKKKRASVLSAAKVTVMSKSDCENAMEGLVNITKGMSCVTSVENVANNCIAEAGGPLLINHQLAGVVAYAPPCQGESTKPVAVTNVGTYGAFIITVLCEMITRY